MKKFIKKLKKIILLPFLSLDAIIDIRDILIRQQTETLQNRHPNPLNKFGKKCFSQSDEDGILLEIIRRMRIEKGYYLELGVGDGMENNTLILAALGWKGFWIGSEKLKFEYYPSSKFFYLKTWITLSNLISNINIGLSYFSKKNVDLISIDLDGNDIYFVEEILKNELKPKIFIVEYNGFFIPPVEFKIEYNSNHQWLEDNYYGASLASYVKVFARYKYTLICCNSHTGANAFFIKDEYLSLFSDIPKNINDLYSVPKYFLYQKFGHKISKKVVQKLLSD